MTTKKINIEVGGSAKIEYQFDDNNEVFASSIYTDYQDEELRSNYIFRFDNGATTVTSACPAVAAPPACLVALARRTTRHVAPVALHAVLHGVGLPVGHGRKQAQ